jgi:hypothetical protein
MFRKLETTCLTRKQHDAVLDTIRTADRDSTDRLLFQRLTFQWSLGGALVHGEPADIASLREFIRQADEKQAEAREFVKAAALGLDFNLFDE